MNLRISSAAARLTWILKTLDLNIQYSNLCEAILVMKSTYSVPDNKTKIHTAHPISHSKIQVHISIQENMRKKLAKLVQQNIAS